MFLRWAVAASLIVALAGCSDSSPTASPVSSPASVAPSSEIPAPSATAPPATSTATPAPAPASSGRFDGIQLVKSGGIAGITETTTIKPDGTWNIVKGKTGITKTGKLSSADLGKVVTLATDPRVQTEADRKWPTRGTCNDAFSYLLIVGFRMIRYEGCPSAGEQPPLAVQIIGLVQQVTK
ncbi:hypothetical protein [Actinoplanes sp. NPDC026619]|uniref:hypothetical protein n=1 Tax=Actinoplanes sp. NPDC026619 TaxID=3155798 RepID=UPI0033E1E3E6